MVTTRLLAISIAFLATCTANATLGFEGADSRETLNVLLAEYRSHALPLPPDSARLVVRSRVTCIVNDVPQVRSELALFIAPGEKPNTGHYWFGCEPVLLDITRPDADAKLTNEIVAGTEPMELDWQPDGFTPFPDLALAIQCHARGWDDLAHGLLERARKSSTSRIERRLLRSGDFKEAVARLAWNHWFNQFAKIRGDRSAVVKHLRRLIDGPYGIDSKANRNIVSDMEETLATGKVESDGLEAAIDALIDLDIETSWPGCRYPFSNNINYTNRDLSLRKLRDAGLEAVPSLIKHLRDNRLTRCIEACNNSDYSWHVRIADVVAALLNGLHPEGFAYDFRESEGRGVSLDERHVMHWWTEGQGAKAIDYLVKAAITADSQGRLQANDGVLHAMGQRYPNQLVTLFEEHIEKLGGASALFQALDASKASDDQKVRLFLIAAKSNDSWKRSSALRYLLLMKHSEAVPLLVRELENLPHTPKVPYWHSEARYFAELVTVSDDERVREAFYRAAERVDVGQRLEMIQAVGNCSRKRLELAIRILRRFLDDETVRTLPRSPDLKAGEDPFDVQNNLYSGLCAGFTFDRLAVRDFAALQIAHKLELVTSPSSAWRDADWAKLRETVSAALAARDAGPDVKKDCGE